jgi:NAD-dependent DNA ligase
MFKKVLSIMSLDAMLRLAKDGLLGINLMGLPGFGEKTANRVQYGVMSKLPTIEYLLKQIKLKAKVEPGQLKGKVCFSQVRDAEFEKELVSNGYEVVDSLTKTTTYLVVPNLEVKSSKITKAQKYGIEVLSLNDAKLKLK